MKLKNGVGRVGWRAVDALHARPAVGAGFDIGGELGGGSRGLARRMVRADQRAVLVGGSAVGIEPEPSDVGRSAGVAGAVELSARPKPIVAAPLHRERLRPEALQAGSVVGFDDVPEAALWSPSLTTISVSPRQLGEGAARLLLERAIGTQTDPERVILPPTLVIRDSCGDHPPPA